MQEYRSFDRALRPGFEPGTIRLTGGRSAAELPEINVLRTPTGIRTFELLRHVDGIRTRNPVGDTRVKALPPVPVQPPRVVARPVSPPADRSTCEPTVGLRSVLRPRIRGRDVQSSSRRRNGTRAIEWFTFGLPAVVLIGPGPTAGASLTNRSNGPTRLFFCSGGTPYGIRTRDPLAENQVS